MPDVLMPSRAFIDSDEYNTYADISAFVNVLMPSRAFIDSDSSAVSIVALLRTICLNALTGIY